MNLLSTLSAKQLRRAADLQDKIASLQKKLASYLGGQAVSVAVPGRKRRMSAAGRARIIAAQKARWAKFNSGKPKAAKKTKRTMGAAARARIAAAARARWAKAKASGKRSL